MAWTVPSLDSLSQRLRGAFRQTLPGTDATIWPNSLAVIGKVFALVLFEVHLRLGWLYKQIFASTADTAHLERHAYDLGIARKPPARALGTVTATATPDAAYAAGVRYISGRDVYVSTADATADSGGAITLTLRAETPGAAANRGAGETLNLADPASHTGLATTATVDADGIAGGSEAEDDDGLRARVLDRKRRPPQGASEADYEQFARYVPGITHAWARRFLNGAGTVGVLFLQEGRADGIPIAGDVDALQAVLDERRMICVQTYAIAPTPVPVDIRMELNPDTTTTQTRVETAIRATFAARMTPGFPDDPFTLSKSWIGEAISTALGEASHVLIEPATDLTFTSGQYPTVGSLTFDPPS